MLRLLVEMLPKQFDENFLFAKICTSYVGVALGAVGYFVVCFSRFALDFQIVGAGEFHGFGFIDRNIFLSEHGDNKYSMVFSFC